MNFTPARTGIEWKNDKLYVFSQRRVLVIKGWPEVAAWTRCKQQPQWSRVRPSLDLNHTSVEPVRSMHRFKPRMNTGQAQVLATPVIPMDEKEKNYWQMLENRRQRVASLIATIPPEVREIVSGFPARHWHLLSMAARCPGSLDFLRENQALGFAMASCWAFTKKPSATAMKWIRRMLPRKKRQIAATLGFPDRELAVRILSKIPPSACCMKNLFLLHTRLSGPEIIKALAHVETFDQAVLSLLEPTRFSALDPRVIIQVGSRKPLPVDREVLPSMIDDHFYMSRELSDKKAMARRFHSIESLLESHDAIMRRWQMRVYSRGEKLEFVEFPKPPLPGTSQIIPITTLKELQNEGVQQKNCVLSRASIIADGKSYIYRMLAPDRATIEMRRLGNKWELFQVAAKQNAPVSNVAREALIEWLGPDADKVQFDDIPF